MFAYIPSLETSEDVESLALQKAHTDALNIAKEKLETVPMEQRDYTSVTMAITFQKNSRGKSHHSGIFRKNCTLS